MSRHTNYMIRLVLKTGDVLYHDFFVGSREQARDYAYRYASERGIRWPLGKGGYTYGFELFAKVTP